MKDQNSYTVSLSSTAETRKLKEQPKKPRNVFINELDSYIGHNISQVLTGHVYYKKWENTLEEESDSHIEESSAYDSKIYGVNRNQQNACNMSEYSVLSADEAADKEKLLSALESCDVLIYDITTGGQKMIEEATWAAETLHGRLKQWKKQKTFLLLSTVMTWARTKYTDHNYSPRPLTEYDFRRRRAHPEYQRHLNCEKNILMLGKTNKAKFRTYVIAAGALFGIGEDMFHPWMKKAWQNYKELPIYSIGSNIIPMLHIRDFTTIIEHTIDRRRNEFRYILAVNGMHNSQEQIITAISQEFSTGQVKQTYKRDAFHQEMRTLYADLITTDLLMEGVVFSEDIEKRHSLHGFVDGIADVANEYRAERSIQPIRICILGPPVSGKSFLAQKLSQMYRLQHIHAKAAIERALQELEIRASPSIDDVLFDVTDSENSQEEEYSDSSESYDEEGEKKKALQNLIEREDAQDRLEELSKEREGNKTGRLNDETVIEFVKEWIKSKPCQNQGYILDGFPKLTSQTEAVFRTNTQEEITSFYDVNVQDKCDLPDLVVVLDAPDDIICKRAMSLPEEEVYNTHWTEQGILRRLKKYRQRNRKDTTLINLFEDQDVSCITVDVSNDFSPNFKHTVQLVETRIGAPRNFGPTQDELEKINEIKECERREQEMKLRDEKERCARKERERQHQEDQYILKRATELKTHESSIMQRQTIPLKRYLIKDVIPLLTEGLVMCANIKPDDAIDFLGEYLLQCNPQTNLEHWMSFKTSKGRVKEVVMQRRGKKDCDITPENVDVCLVSRDFSM